MPELAEVEYYRRQWNEGLARKVLEIILHKDTRIFRGADLALLQRVLPGATLVSSEASGKKMLFRFSGDVWLGIHLGMTGKLRVAPTPFAPGKHDHLVLLQSAVALVFTDARQFGRVSFHQGKETPAWWEAEGPDLTSAQFTVVSLRHFLLRHKRLAIKSTLLLQAGFPGVGNWMADEILWRAGIAPIRKSGELTTAATKKLWREIRFVCREALKKIGKDFSDPPAGWLFHERWKRTGICPIHKTPLRKETIGGRTTAWCQKCQPKPV